MNDMIESNKFVNIITKGYDINNLEFKTINDESLIEINSWMTEVNRSVSCFNRTNSQTTLSLMTLTMLDASPYRMLRQILAQVENKRSALNSAVYRIEKKKLEHRQLEIDIKNELEEIDKQKLILKRNKIVCDIIDSQGPIEAALKELGALKRNYEAIIRNKNIPENWDELDFETQEIEHHIKCIFRNAIRDRLQGSMNHGTMEYMEQFGINPITAYALTDNYINSIREHIANDKGPDIVAQYNFYQEMFNIFKNEYKKAMNNIGLDTIIHSDFLMKESK